MSSSILNHIKSAIRTTGKLPPDTPVSEKWLCQMVVADKLQHFIADLDSKGSVATDSDGRKYKYKISTNKTGDFQFRITSQPYLREDIVPKVAKHLEGFQGVVCIRPELPHYILVTRCSSNDLSKCLCEFFSSELRTSMTMHLSSIGHVKDRIPSADSGIIMLADWAGA